MTHICAIYSTTWDVTSISSNMNVGPAHKHHQCLCNSLWQNGHQWHCFINVQWLNLWSRPIQLQTSMCNFTTCMEMSAWVPAV